jgi:O-antigen/teichoic acid export membrane protein
MLVVLAKLGSAEMVGQFALGLAVAAPVFLLTNLALREVLVTDAEGAHAFGDYLALRILTTLAGLLCIAGIAALVNYRWETKVAILLVGVVKAVEAVSDMLYGLMQQHERMELIAGSIAARGVLAVMVFAAAVYLLDSVLVGLALVALAWALVLAAYDLPTSTRLLGGAIAPRWGRFDLLRLFRLTLPLGVTVMLASLSAMIPRYFIERYHGEQELGIFVAIAYVAVVGSTVVNALGQSASARLARSYADGDRRSVRTLLAGMTAVAVLMGATGVAVAALCGGPLLAVLYRPEYAAHVDTLLLVMAAAAVGYVAAMLGYAITAARLFRVQMPLFAGVTAVAALSCADRVPAHGALGAAQATIMTAIANLLGVIAVNAYALGHLGAAARTDAHVRAPIRPPAPS